MSRVKRVVAQHVERFFRQIALGDLINIFVVAKREMDVVEAAVRFIDAVLGLIASDFAVGVGREKFRENDFAGIGTAHWKRIAHYSPLRLAVKTQHLAEVVHEAGEYEPARMAVFADRFGGLQQMLYLRQVGVGIALVHQRVQILGHFPNALFPARQAAIFRFFLQHEIISLLGVVFPVELGDAGVGSGFVVTKLLFGLSLAIPGGNKIVPLF